MILKICGILYIPICIISFITVLFNEFKYIKLSFKDSKKHFFKGVVRLILVLLFAPIWFSIEILKKEY